MCCVFHVCVLFTVDIDPLAADGNDSNDCNDLYISHSQLHVISERDDSDDGNPMTTTISYRSHLIIDHTQSHYTNNTYNKLQVSIEIVIERELLNPLESQTNLDPLCVMFQCRVTKNMKR